MVVAWLGPNLVASWREQLCFPTPIQLHIELSHSPPHFYKSTECPSCTSSILFGLSIRKPSACVKIVTGQGQCSIPCPNIHIESFQIFRGGFWHNPNSSTPPAAFPSLWPPTRPPGGNPCPRPCHSALPPLPPHFHRLPTCCSKPIQQPTIQTLPPSNRRSVTAIMRSPLRTPSSGKSERNRKQS